MIWWKFIKNKLCDYCEVYILVTGTITVAAHWANNEVIQAHRKNKTGNT